MTKLVLFPPPSLDALSPFHVRATLPPDSEAILKAWISAGSWTRLQIRPTFDDNLGLPEEAVQCGNKSRGLTIIFFCISVSVSLYRFR